MQNTKITKTEYHAGDTIDLIFMGAAYLTGSNKNIYATIQLAKPIGSDVKTMTVTLTKVEIRQAGTYLVNGTPTGITANFIKSTMDFARIVLEKSSGFGGTNNDTVGIYVSGKIILA